jgi:hypothetical protein
MSRFYFSFYLRITVFFLDFFYTLFQKWRKIKHSIKKKELNPAESLLIGPVPVEPNRGQAGLSSAPDPPGQGPERTTQKGEENHEPLYRRYCPL